MRKWQIVSAQVTTVQEDIDPSQKPFRDLIDVDLLGEAAELEATHVLVGIDWGAVGTITCEDENHDSEEATKVKGALQAELNKLKGQLNASGSASASRTRTNQQAGSSPTTASVMYSTNRETFLLPSRELLSRPGNFLQPWLDTTRAREFPSPSG